MHKFLKILIFTTLIIFATFSCSPGYEEKKDDKLVVTSSIVPISSIINYIGGDKVEVNNIVPAGANLHDYDAKVSDIKSIENSDLIIYIGYDHIDGFLDKMISDKKVLRLANKFDIDEETENSHIWFGFKNMQIISENIYKKLAELDNENGDFYNQNYIKLINELDEIIKNFKSENEGKTPQKFIVYHDAYSYLLQDLSISLDNQLIFNSNHSADLSVKQMKEFQDKISEENIKIIFKEPQAENSSLEQIISENNLEVYDLDPLGNDDSANAYLQNLKNNLEALSHIYD